MAIVVLMGIVLSTLPIKAALPEIILSQVDISIDAPESLKQDLKQLITLHSGQVTTENQIKKSLRAINKLELFENADYTLTPTGHNSYRLQLHLTKARKVRGINVRGNYPILGKDIKRLVTMQPGSIFDPALITESTEAIQNYLTKNGYYDSEIHIEPKVIKKYNVIDLFVRIHKGKTYRVGKITLTGNNVLTTRRIENILQHFSRFQLTRFKKDLKRIKTIYARKGYIKAHVKLGELTYHDDTGKVDISLVIRENKKLRILIEGRTFLPKSHLKDVTQLEKRRSYDSIAIQNGEKRLISYYHRLGFPSVAVNSEVSKPNPDEVIVKYKIIAGRRVELKKIKFDGNKSIGAKKLKKNFLSQESSLMSRQYFNERYLTIDSTRLLQTYKDHGFFDAEIGEPEITLNKQGDQNKVVFPIDEGPSYVLGSIKIHSDLPVDEEFLLKKINLKVGKEYDKDDIDAAKIKTQDILQENGFAYAVIETPSTINRSASNVDLVFEINRGIKTTVRSIIIDGNLLTRESTIKKNLKIKPGDLFTYQNMLDAQLNLRKLGTFSSVRITPLGFQEKSDQIDLIVSVIERKSIIVNVQGGFDSRHLGTGEFNFTKLNLFGSARQFNTRLIGGPKFNRGEVTFYSPRIFGASWNLSNQYFAQYEETPNFHDYSYGGFVNTLKNFGPHWTFGFKEQVTRTDLIESDSNTAALGASIFDNTLNEFQLSSIFDTRDNFSDPKKGIYALARNEISTDITSIGKNFNTIELNVSHFQGFLKRFTLVNTLRFGQITKLSGNPTIPANKLFFLGGSDTIRGFSEDGVDPAGGTSMLLYNGELQIGLRDTFKIAGFFDAGVLNTDLNHVGLSQVRESAGMGLRYFTPIGPLRLDWGFILDRQPGEPSNRIHFSFGYFF